MIRLADFRKASAVRLTDPVVGLLGRAHVSPNAVTWTGFGLSLAAAGLVGFGYPVAAGIVMLVAGFFDMLDGALARHTGQTSRFGGILDSTLDRLSEAALLVSIMVFYAGQPSVAGVLLAGLALAGSLTVSYVRARAEAAGLESKEGLFTRPERVIVLALALLFSRFSFVLIAALAIIVIFSFFTVGQRLVQAWRQTKGQK